MKHFFKRLSYRLGYIRRRMQAPARLRKARGYIERVCKAQGTDVCKTPDEITAELLELIRTRHVLPFRDLISDYFELMLHIRGANPADFVFMNEWKAAVAPLGERLDPALAAAVDNKQEHSALFRKHGLRVPAIMGLLSAREGRAVICAEDGSGTPTPLTDVLREHKALFCKPLAEFQGRGCALLEALPAEDKLRVNGKEQSLNDFITESLTGGYQLLVEEAVQQHETIAAFHPASVNTLRVWTIWAKNGPEYFQGALRMGRGGKHVDNVHAGGICIGVKDDGALFPGAYVATDLTTEIITEHPDTHVAFDGVKIPFYEEAKKLCCAAHSLYPREVFDLGWDIAITPTGPLIIEVNSKASVTGMQLTGMAGWQERFRKKLLPEIQAVLRG